MTDNICPTFSIHRSCYSPALSQQYGVLMAFHDSILKLSSLFFPSHCPVYKIVYILPFLKQGRVTRREMLRLCRCFLVSVLEAV